MQTTNYLLPQTLISSNGWTTPQNILLDDGSYAISNATSTLTSELVVGNFLFNLPTNSIVSGIEIEIKGKRGPLTNPASTLQIYAYDNTNNNNALYQYTPVFSNIDTVDGVYTLGSNIYTFGQTLTAEQMNNLKFKLIANSEMYVDSFKVRVFYGEPSTGTLPVIDGACQTIIQAQKFSLVDNVSSTDTTILVSKFETPDGVLITNTDIDPTQAAAGKGIPITVSHATRREENMYVTSIEHLTNGYTRLTVTRGWSFKQPIGQLVSRNKAHPVGNEVIISNSTPFYDELLRKCDIGTLVSAPIKVEDESVNITNYLRSLNFIGAGVTAVSTPAITGGGHDVDVTITGYGNQPINITNVTNITSGGNQVTTLSTNITTEGTDTALVVALSLEAGKTVTGVTYNSLPLLFGGAQNQNDVRVEVWYMANPSGGNHTITATFSSATYSCFEAASLSGVDQTTPFVSLIGSGGNSLSSVGSVTTLTPNSTFFHALATREVGMTYTAALGETLNSTSLSGAVQGALASKLVGTPSTQNSQINLSILNDWANLLFAIQPTPVLPPIITPGQVSIQFQDESINLGTTGTVDTVDFTGSGVTATRTGNKVTVNVTGGADEQVKVSATDTTTGYLDNKIELTSNDSSVTIAKTILNPLANEKIEYDLSVDISALNSNIVPTLIPMNVWDTSNGSFASKIGVSNYVQSIGNVYSIGAYGKSVVTVAPSNTIQTLSLGVCHDYSLGKIFTASIVNLGGGNFTLNVRRYDSSDITTQEAIWSCSGSSTFALPSPGGFGLVVDQQSLKLFITTGPILGVDTIDTTILSPNTTHVFDLSSASGGSIIGTAVSFSGVAKFPNTITDPLLINSTTKKFITLQSNNKYTYSDTLGITATNVINFGDYSGENVVFNNGILYKVNIVNVPGGPSGINTIYTDFIQSYAVPTSNTILNT